MTKDEDLLAGVHPPCDVAFERNRLHKKIYSVLQNYNFTLKKKELQASIFQSNIFSFDILY